MKHVRTTRRGFSLIELITVIAIISLLLALSAGALFRVRSGQTRSNTIATMKKINGALDNRWKAINDSVQTDARNGTAPYRAALSEANGDSEIAKALLRYAKIKNELPMTIAEAKAVTIVGTGATPIILQPRAHFTTAFTGINSTASPEESGVCLFIALTNSGGDGAIAEGGLDQQAVSTDVGNPAKSFKAFGDAWGTPIAFVRQCYAAEVQATPYVKGAPFDPFDPSPTHKAASALTSSWSSSIMSGFPTFAIPANAPNIKTSYSGTLNFLPTVISAGQNTKWGSDFYGDDNILGFRLREGTQGN